MESGILLMIGIHNPGSTDKYWNQVTGIQNPDPFPFNLKNCCESYPHAIGRQYNRSPCIPNIFPWLVQGPTPGLKMQVDVHYGL